MRKWLTILAAITAGVVIGAAGMYFYTKGRVVQASRLVLEHHAWEKKYNALQTANAELERRCSTMEHHKQQEGVFYAEALRQNVQIRALKEDRFLMALTYGDPDAVRRVLAKDPDLAQDMLLEISRETSLHKIARSNLSSAVEITKILIDHGADRTAKNMDGKTPAQVARREGGLGAVIRVLEGYEPNNPIRISSSAP